MKQGLSPGNGYMNCPVIRQAVNNFQGFFAINKNLWLLLPDVAERTPGNARVCYGKFRNLYPALKKSPENVSGFAMGHADSPDFPIVFFCADFGNLALCRKQVPPELNFKFLPQTTRTMCLFRAFADKKYLRHRHSAVHGITNKVCVVSVGSWLNSFAVEILVCASLGDY